LQHPGANEFFARDAAGPGHLPDRFGLPPSQGHANRAGGRGVRRFADEDGLGDLFQFALEIGQVVGVPELGQFADRIGFRWPAFFIDDLSIG
jgi:hypothetical protein